MRGDRVLYVCSQGVIRSRTAEVLTLFGGVTARSCGIDADALAPASNALATWAEIVVCMERRHQRYMNEFMGMEEKPSVCLDLPDIYRPFEPKLVRDLISRLVLQPQLQAAVEMGYRLYVQHSRDEPSRPANPCG